MKAYEWASDWNLQLNELQRAFLASDFSPPTSYPLFDGGPEHQQLHLV